jgi:group I intron endonuclease
MDYKNGKIYKLLNTITDDIYVGSTCSPLLKRLYGHKIKSKYGKSGNPKVYSKMQELGVDKFYIELIELYPCQTKNELITREGVYIKQMGTLNGKVSGRTTHEYKQEYRNTHRDQIKQYNIKHKERSKVWHQKRNHERKEELKQRREQNKEAKKEYDQKYRALHGEEINKKQRERRRNAKEEQPTI